MSWSSKRFVFFLGSEIRNHSNTYTHTHKYKSLRRPTHFKIILSLFGPTTKNYIYI